MRLRSTKFLYLAAFLSALLLASACRKSEGPKTSPSRTKLVIVTTLYPLFDFSRFIGGDRVVVSLLLPPGVEAHSFSPKPEDVVRVSQAGMFIFSNEIMEPWAVKFVTGLNNGNILLVNSGNGVKFLETGSGVHEGHAQRYNYSSGSIDPHIWLDFFNAQIMVDNIAAGMASKDPANRDYYLANASLYKSELNKLDQEYKIGLSSCAKKLFLHGGHFTFGYLANRYELYYEAASAVNADAEPTPMMLIELVKKIKSTGLKYIFSEEMLSPRVSEMIARESGASLLLLHGAHNISREDLEHGVTFISLMKKNLASLRTGLECR